MANVKFPRKEFEKLLGKKVDAELEKKIPLFGTPIETLTDQEIELEIFPNRPDLLSMHGFLRSFKQFLGKKVPEYKIKKPKENYIVKIDPSVKTIRPYTVCAIVKGLDFNDQKIKELVDLQEKLHSTLGRQRKKLAIGVYPLEKIKLPITYRALPPSKVKFLPLEATREMTGEEILKKHPTGKTYAHLLEGKKQYPIFQDATGEILSLPPIINSHKTGKVTEKTKDVFVECSGFHLETLQKALNIIVTTLADCSGTVYAMNLQLKGSKITTPNLTPEKTKVSLEETNKLLGLSLKESEFTKLLERMGHTYKKGHVYSPAWRADILHEVDLIEDVAIAYGYDKFIPEIPEVATVGEESKKTKVQKKISELLIGLGLQEILTYHLIKPEEAKKLKLPSIELEDTKTEYKLLRSSLLPSTLRIHYENKDQPSPYNLFEVGTCFSPDNNSESGIKESEKLLVSLSPSGFTNIKQILETITSPLGLKYELKESTLPFSIEGRTGDIIVNEKKVGYICEIHPQTLRDFNIKMPIAVFELDLSALE